jgi:hypothetical protein
MTQFKCREKAMLPIESLWSFIAGIVAYGGGATVIAYFAFQFFGKSWLDNKFAKGLEKFRHEKDIEIQKLRIEIEALLSGKIKLQERDFAILPEAWSKLNIAHKNLASTVSAFQQYPDLNNYNKEELQEFLQGEDFSDILKSRILKAHKPNEPYIEAVTWKRIRAVRLSISQFKDYVDTNGIFLPTELKQKFGDVAQAMWEAIIAKEVGHESKDWKMQSESFTALEKDVLPKIRSIESEINEVLNSHARVLR